MKKNLALVTIKIKYFSNHQIYKIKNVKIRIIKKSKLIYKMKIIKIQKKLILV